jgi:hypothetical protein
MSRDQIIVPVSAAGLALMAWSAPAAAQVETLTCRFGDSHGFGYRPSDGWKAGIKPGETVFVFKMDGHKSADVSRDGTSSIKGSVDRQDNAIHVFASWGPRPGSDVVVTSFPASGKQRPAMQTIHLVAPTGLSVVSHYGSCEQS